MERVTTVIYGVETASYARPKIWNSIPRECKECDFLNEFKARIKNLVSKKSVHVNS